MNIADSSPKSSPIRPADLGPLYQNQMDDPHVYNQYHDDFEQLADDSEDFLPDLLPTKP